MGKKEKVGRRVRPGEMMRDFSLPDMEGNMVKLSDYRNRLVLLSFFRDATCPFCNLRLYELTRRHEEFRKQGLEVIAVFNSSPEVIKKYLGKRNRPFPMLGDADKEIFRLYAVESSWGILMKAMFNFSRMFSAFAKGYGPSPGAFKPLLPADFLIDASGRVRATYYSRDAARHISLDIVDKFIVAANRKDAANQAMPISAPTMQAV